MEENLKALEEECKACLRCPLGKTRTNLVFGTGNENARIMLVGEGPGEQEDLQGLHNRDPKPEETELCLPYLRQQVKLIKPAVIVCLGRIAAQRLISPDFRVTRQHGEFFKKGSIYMMGTFHPAALLRDESKKKDALSDFQRLREKIEELQLDIY